VIFLVIGFNGKNDAISKIIVANTMNPIIITILSIVGLFTSPNNSVYFASGTI